MTVIQNALETAKKLEKAECKLDASKIKANIKKAMENNQKLGKRKNQLLEDCAKNIENVRSESLTMVNLIRGFDQISDCERRSEVDSKCRLKSYQLLKSSRGSICWFDRNASGVDLRQLEIKKSYSQKHEPGLVSINSKYFVYLIVLDSVKHRKLAEMICRVDNTFEEIAQNIHCTCSQIDTSSFPKFFLIGDYLICDLESLPKNSDAQ